MSIQAAENAAQVQLSVKTKQDDGPGDAELAVQCKIM